MKSAELWLGVAEEKLEMVTDEEAKKVLDNFKEEVSVHKITEEKLKLSEDLCKKLESTVHEENFQSSSISCRYVQEGAIPFSVRKLEELSVEPAVYRIHNFLSKKEADTFHKKAQKFEYLPSSLRDFEEIVHSKEQERFFEELGKTVSSR